MNDRRIMFRVILTIAVAIPCPLGFAEAPVAVLGAFLDADPPEPYAVFGAGVTVDGPWCAVGVPGDDAAGVNAGAIEVFATESWSSLGVLRPSIAVGGDQWGEALDLSGGVLIVGSGRASFGPPGSGRVTIFQSNGSQWTQSANLAPSDPVAQGGFGSAVAIDGTTAIIGAPGALNGGVASGAAYIATLSGGTWSVVKRFAATAGSTLDRYGGSVTISGGWAAIGAPGSDAGGADAGAVFLLRKIGTQWFAAGSILAPSPQPGDRFGVAVSMSGNRLAVGAYRRDGASPDSGAVFIYSLSGTQWSVAATIAPSELEEFSEFGFAVSLHASTLVVGAPMAPSASGSPQGRSWVFDQGQGWAPRVQVAPEVGSELLLFGESVATDGTMLVIGAPFGGTVEAPYSGRTYRISLTADCDANGTPDLEEIAATGDCNLNSVPDACDIASGSSEDSNGDGTPDECQGPLCPADLNSDGLVGGADLAGLLANWGGNGGGDLNSDGQVDGADLAGLLAAWGKCP